MRVIFEPGDKPEQRELMMDLQRCGMAFVIVDETTKKLHRKLSDKEYRDAITLLVYSFTVGRQWAAVYRILVDLYGFPSGITAFCDRINVLMKGVAMPFPCNYQSIQKPLASHAILRKHYSKWQTYEAKGDDKVFPRQKKTADRLLELLGGTKCTMEDAE